MEVREIGNIVRGGNWESPQRGRVYSVKGLCPTLNTVGGGGLEPKIITEIADKPKKKPKYIGVGGIHRKN